MLRATVKDIAKMTSLHPHTVRAWADKGLIDHRRDFRGWRFFPDPVKTVRQVQGLLNGEVFKDDTG